MSRRPSLPGAAELFRSTGGSGSGSGEAPASAPAPVEPRRAPAADRLARLGVPRDEPADDADLEDEPTASVTAFPAEPPRLRASEDFAEPVAPRGRVRQTRRQPTRGGVDRRPSGRERHDEKITVYCSAEELFELERARLALRGDHGLVVDRGRIVREAVAVVLADLDAKGESSILVRRLRES